MKPSFIIMAIVGGFILIAVEGLLVAVIRDFIRGRSYGTAAICVLLLLAFPAFIAAAILLATGH